MEQRSLQACAQQWAALQARRAELQFPAFVAKLSALREELQTGAAALAELERNSRTMDSELADAQKEQPFWRSWQNFTSTVLASDYRAVDALCAIPRSRRRSTTAISTQYDAE